MREILTSGSVRGRGAFPPAYSTKSLKGLHLAVSGCRR
jgi:hypothetical protein